ncbi:MAG: hypothetical protein JW821_17885 [Deltaproteobacteria bacterium]|nr:hypothetical protein [Deltaproteobacteria bacterium]
MNGPMGKNASCKTGTHPCKNGLAGTVTRLLGRHISPFGVALGACVLLALLYPGDIPWINDEPVLIDNALKANIGGRLAARGLHGSAGIPYGPVPTWIYQALLVLSRNPIHLSLMKNLLSQCALIWGLLFFSRRTGLSPWPVFLVLLSPYVYLYNRLLWDNVFLIPLSVLLWCAALQFWQQNTRSAFVFMTALCVILMHIHAMAVFLVLPLASVLLLVDRGWLRSHLPTVSICIVLALVACFPHLSQTLPAVSFGRDYRAGLFSSSLAVPLGAGYFSFLGFGDYFLPEIYGGNFLLPPPLTKILVALTATIFFPFFLGVLKGVRTLIRKWKEKTAFSPEDRVLAVALLSLLLCMAFFIIIRHHHHPHYTNAMGFTYFYFIWRGLDAGLKASLGWIKGLLAFQAGTMGVMLLLLILFIHVNGGNCGIRYGATLSNQIDIVRTILQYSPKSRISNFVSNYGYFPHAYSVLVTLFLPEKIAPNLPVRDISLCQNPASGRGWIYLKISDNLAGER